MSGPSYRPLNRSRSEIRLISLHPARDAAADIVCDLIHVSIDLDPVYEALSYTWKSDAPLDTIVLDGTSFGVTANLKNALIRLRLHDKPRRLWVDALCINQQDILERNHEVLRMGQIYRQAECVIVWLGSAQHDTDLAIDHLEELAEMNASIHAQCLIVSVINDLAAGVASLSGLLAVVMRLLIKNSVLFAYFAFYSALLKWVNYRIVRWWAYLELFFLLIQLAVLCIAAFPLWYEVGVNSEEMATQAVDPQADSAAIKAVSHLFDSDWFTRTWILQEIAFARKAIFVCGYRTISLDKLWNATQGIAHLVNHDTRPSPYWSSKYQTFTAFGLVTNGTTRGVTSRTRKRSLLLLLNSFSHHSTSDPRDKVYGLLGLSEEGQSLLKPSKAGSPILEPDYNKTASVVYAETAKFLVQYSNDLLVLRACLYAGSVQDLPSWVPDWTVTLPRWVGSVTPEQTSCNFEPSHIPVAEFSNDLREMTVRGLVVGILCKSPTDGTAYTGLKVTSHDTTVGSMADPKTSPKVPSMEPGMQIAMDLMHCFGLCFYMSLKIFPGMTWFLASARDRDFLGLGYVFDILLDDLNRTTFLEPGSFRLGTMKGFVTASAVDMTEEVRHMICPISFIGPYNFLMQASERPAVTTSAQCARLGDVVVVLSGSRVPFIIRPVRTSVDESKAHENEAWAESIDPQHSTSTTENLLKYRLIGPATFGTRILDASVRNSVKKFYVQYPNMVQQFVLA